MKVEFKGIVTSISSKEVKPNEVAQTVTIRRPERKDEFGDVIQKESFFEVQQYVKEAEKNDAKILDAEEWQNKKVLVTAYLNSNPYETKEGVKMNILNLSLRKLEVIQ